MLKSFLSLWLKFPCPLCGRITDQVICGYCQNKLFSYKLKDPGTYWQGTLPLFAWAEYEGEVKAAIAKLKYDNHPEIGVLLGKWLGDSWQHNSPISSRTKPLIVPIPMYGAKQKTRGYNQANLVAKGFSEVTGYSVATKAVMRVRDTLPMFGLDPKAREDNLDGAFALSRAWQQKPPSQPVLLLDDIYTLGTTVRQVSKLLTRNQIRVIGAIAVAKAV